MQYKHLEAVSSQFKFADDAQGVFEGYASVFGGIDSYGDTIMPGAYKATLTERERPIHMRDNHFGPIIGKWTEIKEDDHGLFVRGELTPGHSIAGDRLASLKHGAISGLSIGFRLPEGGAKTRNGVRELHAIDLVEISVVEDPADMAAQINAVKHDRAVIEQLESEREIEGYLRDACGLSKRNAVTLMARYKSLCLRDEDTESKADQLAAAIASISLNPKR